jgi:hypothetical protein
MYAAGEVLGSFQSPLDERLVDDRLGGDIPQITFLPRFHLLSHRLEVPLHSINAERDAVDELYKKQLTTPSAQSLVPETCLEVRVFASLVGDSVRRAKADFPLVPLCPVKSMAPVLAIAGMVARAIGTTAL